ncbi:MOSC domain-containing protein [Candidatus Solirubrobacter pratensis]|uniref:MOSC domain-containing protein n=1 Tax=Candidatus Solirubrobacter pratensis TaxID=1298857 RepID=UPI0004218E23|nr:MOSC domain-containing protein [Candidatus Solirubrobacter pratensis]
MSELCRYPVKSMAAERLESVALGWHGFEGDRRWAFVRPGLERSDFPWLTIRERADMGQFRPRLADPSRPDDSRTIVETPEGDDFDVVDPRLAAALGDGVRVIKQNRGVFDTAPVSLISAATVRAISHAAEVAPDVRRFRPNVVVDAGDEPYEEDAWIGRVLRLGEAEMRVDQRDKRCVMVDVDPESSQRRPGLLRTIAQRRSTCLGVYGTTVTPGRISIGDPVYLA